MNLKYLFFLMFYSPLALTCVRIADSNISIVGSYAAGQQTNRGRSTQFDLAGCKPFEGQYLVLVNAPIYTDLQFKSISSAEGELPEERCYIANSPFSISKPQDIDFDKFYRLETKFINTCLEAEVTDKRGLIDTTKQINCEITQISSNKVIARGPRCAFKIGDKSDFKVVYRLNPSCLKKSFLQSDGELRPMDVKASLEIYKTPDLTPGNPEYDILTMTNARITLQPDKNLIPVSTYTGVVGSQWPMQYGTQIEMGKVMITQTQRLHGPPFVFLKTPFVVNNNCSEVCKDGLCTSPCDYYAPVSARMTLMRKGANENRFQGIDYWYQGATVPGKFLGELALGRKLTRTEIAVGDRFLVIAEFSNPALTYRSLSEEARKILIKLDPIKMPTKNIGRAGLNGLEGLGSNLLPVLAGLPGIGSISDGKLDLSLVLRSLHNFTSTDDSWPPFYKNIVNGDLADNPNRIFQKLKVGFRIAGISPSGAIAMDHVTYFKESKIFGNFEKLVTEPPQIKCNREQVILPMGAIGNNDDRFNEGPMGGNNKLSGPTEPVISGKILERHNMKNGDWNLLVELQDGDVKNTGWVYYDPEIAYNDWQFFDGEQDTTRNMAIAQTLEIIKSKVVTGFLTASPTGGEFEIVMPIEQDEALADALAADSNSSVNKRKSNFAIIPDRRYWSPQCTKFIDAQGNINSWGEAIITAINRYPEFLNETADDMKNYCPNFTKFNKAEKENFWVWFIAAVAMRESSCKPEAKAKGPNGIAAGLLQLHLNKEYAYHKDCEKTRALEPIENLSCGAAMFDNQLITYNKMFLAQGSYWEVLQTDSSSRGVRKLLSLYRPCF